MGRIEMSIPDRIEAIIDNPDWLHSFRHHAREVLNETGHLPETPLWWYLEWKHDKAPIHFNRNHPEFQRLFHDAARHHPTVPSPGMPLGSILGGPQPGTVDRTSPVAETVPEPSGAVLLGPAMVVLMAWARWRRR